MTELRKVFYYENDKNAPVLAAGVLFVSKKKGIINVLIQKEYNNNNQKFLYSDFGGKTAFKDKSIEHTIARELNEEINDSIYNIKTKVFLEIEDLVKLIKDNLLKKIYIGFAKYLLVIVNFDEKVYNIDHKKVGKYEKLDNIKRDVKWIKSNNFVKYYYSKKLHPRIFGYSIIDFFTII